MDEALQAMCLMAGANSMFTGDTLLTTDNPAFEQDRALLARLGMRPEQAEESDVDVTVGPCATADRILGAPAK